MIGELYEEALQERAPVEIEHADGRVVLEADPPGTDPPGTDPRVEPLRPRSDRSVGEWFTWARVPVGALPGLAAACAAAVTECWEEAGRWFVVLRS